MFESLSNRIFAALAAAGLLMAAFLFGFGLGRDGPRLNSSDYGLIQEVEQTIRDAGGEVDHRVLVQGAVKGMLEALGDPYAEYLDRTSHVSFNDFTTGEFTGVGLWLKDDEAGFKVVSVLPGTPAEEAGILGGDLLLLIDGEEVEGRSLEEVVNAIKGDPGTSVTVTLRRGEQVQEFTLTRVEIALPSVESSITGDIGWIRVITFSGGSGKQVREGVRSLVSAGAEGVILDLRGNPGGLVDEAIDIAGAFLDGGLVVSYRESDRAEMAHIAPGPQETRLPLVVLVDEGSASAAEIVAGALQDRGRAIVVGSETYGKGSIQKVFPLSDGSAVKLTVAAYHLPSGREIGERGIIPDVSVLGAEAQVARARQILQQLLAAA